MSGEAWGLCQIVGPDGASRAAITSGDTVRALPGDVVTTTAAILDDWAGWARRLRSLDVADLARIDGAQLTTTIEFPRKVLGSGANYYDHAAEMKTEAPDPSDPPFFFLKPPTTTVVAPTAAVVVDDLAASWLDWEVELAVVIGSRAHNVAEKDAGALIAGYAVSNDLSARGRFARERAIFPPFAFDWLQHKGLDSSCPLGPIVPAWLVPDPLALGLHLWVNGEKKQESSTSKMVVPVNRLVAAASRYVTLEPGDVILTGTPAGVAMPRREFLKDGDVVTAEIDGLGRLENRIVDRS